MKRRHQSENFEIDLKLHWIVVWHDLSKEVLIHDHPGGGAATFYGLPVLGGCGSPPIVSPVANMRSCCQDLQECFSCCCQPVLGEEIQVWGMAAVKISCRRKPNRWSKINIWIVILSRIFRLRFEIRSTRRVACYNHSWMCHAGEYGWWAQRWNPNWRPTHFDGQTTRWSAEDMLWASELICGPGCKFLNVSTRHKFEPWFYIINEAFLLRCSLCQTHR